MGRLSYTCHIRVFLEMCPAPGLVPATETVGPRDVTAAEEAAGEAAAGCEFPAVVKLLGSDYPIYEAASLFPH